MAFYKQLSKKLLTYHLPEKPPPPEPSTDESVHWERDVPVVSRLEWGALPSRTDTGEPLKRQPWPHPYVLWTFSQTEECFSEEDCARAMRDMQQCHMDMGMPDIQYNFYIGGDLNLYEGRGWNTYSGCTYPWFSPMEKMHCAIAYIGRYANQNYPSQEVLEARKSFVLYGMERDFIDYDYTNLCLISNLDQYT